MRISFSGFEKGLVIESGAPHVLEVENRTLFTRVCRSLASGAGEAAVEPYSLWDEDGGELRPSTAFLIVTDPLRLPWDDKNLGGKLYAVLENLMMEDEESRREIEGLGQRLSTAIARLTHQVHADYEFGLEWGMKNYLKSLSFGVARFEESSYLDSLISFLDFAFDMALDRVLVFVNLKSFLTEKDLQTFYDRVFFHDFRVLLLESNHDGSSYRFEKKTRVDLQFLES